MKLRCETCDYVFDADEIHSWIYGDGKDPYFGKCPHCHGIGKFEESNPLLK